MDRQVFLPNFNLWPRIGYEYDLEAIYTNIGHVKCVSATKNLFVEVCEKYHYYFLRQILLPICDFYIGKGLTCTIWVYGQLLSKLCSIRAHAGQLVLDLLL